MRKENEKIEALTVDEKKNNLKVNWRARGLVIQVVSVIPFSMVKLKIVFGRHTFQMMKKRLMHASCTLYSEEKFAITSAWNNIIYRNAYESSRIIIRGTKWFSFNKRGMRLKLFHQKRENAVFLSRILICLAGMIAWWVLCVVLFCIHYTTLLIAQQGRSLFLKISNSNLSSSKFVPLYLIIIIVKFNPKQIIFIGSSRKH